MVWMNRIGKEFIDGQPYLSSNNGIWYAWHNENEKFNDILSQNKKEFGDYLLEKARDCISEFEVRTIIPHYPYLQ